MPAMREKWRGCCGQNVTMPFIISAHEATVAGIFHDAHPQSRLFSRHDPTLRRNRYPIGLSSDYGIILLPKTAMYSDCVAVLQRASQKRNSQSQQRNDSARLLLRD